MESEKREPKIIDMAEHKGRGDSIYFSDYNKICGNMTPIPEKGDYLTNKVNSEKTALYKIIEINSCNDPEINFSGKIDYIGCIEDIQEALISLGEKLQEVFKLIMEPFSNLANNEDFQKGLLEYEKAKKDNNQ